MAYSLRQDKKSESKWWLFRAVKGNFPELITVCAAFFILVLVTYFYVSNLMKKQVDLYARSVMEVHQASMRSLLNAHEAALEHAVLAVAFASDTGASPQEIQELIRSQNFLLASQKDLKGVFLSVYGFLQGYYIDANQLIPGEYFYPRVAPWLRGALQTQGVYHSRPYVEPQSGAAVAAVSMAVNDSRGLNIGVLAVDYYLNPIISEVSSYKVAETGYGILLDDSYTILTCRDQSYVGRNFSELPGFGGVLDHLLERKNQTFDYSDRKHNVLVEYVNINEEKYIAFFSPLENGWHVGVVAPLKYYYSEVFSMIPVLTAISTIAAIILGVILIRLNQARLKSEEESSAKSSFLARMSHEIRTPMNAIMGMCELARRNIDKPVAMEYLAEIKHAGSDLLAIINDILDFSKINTGKIELKNLPYNTSSLFYDVIAIIRVRLGDSPKLSLGFKINPQTPSQFLGDEVRIRQILLNLLSNAVKYTPAGKISLRVDFRKCDGERALLLFQVEDTGLGIKEEDLETVFMDFTRLDYDKRGNIEGTGLGLAISRTLCRAMGGDITVTSEVDKGSTFVASVSQVVEDWTPIGNLIVSARPKLKVFSQEEESVPFTAPGFKILVVDDIATNLIVTEGLLSPYSMDVTLTQSAPQAVELATNNNYDFLFIDHMMPEMDGIETLQRIRKRAPRYKNVPMVALTASVMAGIKEMFLASGFDDYLPKPVDIKSLREILEKWVPKHFRIPSADYRRGDADITPESLSIDGVDVLDVLKKVGGNRVNYIKALTIFVQDVQKSAIQFSNVTQNNLRELQQNLFIINNAASNIGAKKIAKEAIFLEKATREADFFTIQLRLPHFQKELNSLVKRVKEKVLELTSPVAKISQLERNEREVLVNLKEALVSRDLGRVDQILGDLSNLPHDQVNQETLEKLSLQISMADYEEASLYLDDYISHGGVVKHGK
ncbi:MAG: response regulator [Deltaproteobacteria bacterium]|nr:response regulator [Deltaproteobacteria bacterium]